MENVQIKIGIIGLGRMGRFYLDEMKKRSPSMGAGCPDCIR